MFFGEVSLAGEIRSVAHLDLRVRESAKLGFVRGFGPSDTKTDSSKLDYRGLGQLANLVDQVMGSE